MNDPYRTAATPEDEPRLQWLVTLATRNERERVWKLLKKRCRTSQYAAVTEEWLEANKHAFMAGTLEVADE